MRIRFQADADLNEDIVSGVIRREPSIDFQTAAEAEFFGLDDISVLTLAAKDGRILVTHDRRTMPSIFSKFISENTSSGLLIISQKVDIRVAIDELVLIWAASEAEEWVNVICTIPL